MPRSIDHKREGTSLRLQRAKQISRSTDSIKSRSALTPTPPSPPLSPFSTRNRHPTPYHDSPYPLPSPPLCSSPSRNIVNKIVQDVNSHHPNHHRLAGLVRKASDSGAEDPGFESRLRRDFSWSSHTSDLKTGTLVAIQPGAWHNRVSAGTGGPSVSIL